MKVITTVFLAAIVGLVAPLRAEPFELGGRTLEIPAPEGYVKVTDDMRELKRLSDQLVDPLNDTLAFYIPRSSAPVALAGGLPPLDRYFLAKTEKRLRAVTVSAPEFAEMRQRIRAQNKQVFEEAKAKLQVFKEAKAKLPGYLEQISRNIKREHDLDVDLGDLRMIPLEPHQDVPVAVSYSMLMAVGRREGKGPTPLRPTTVTIMNANGRVIFLYAYGAQADLAWTRDASASWQAAISSRNPPPPERKANGWSMDWAQVGWTALGGAVIGGLAVLLAEFFARKKQA